MTLVLPASMSLDPPPAAKRTGKGFRMGDLTVMVLREREGEDDVLTLAMEVKGQPRTEARFVGRSRKEFLRAVQDAIHGQTGR